MCFTARLSAHQISFLCAKSQFWMYITAFASISSNRNEALSILSNIYHQSGIDVEEKILFRVENHVFAGEEFESK